MDSCMHNINGGVFFGIVIIVHAQFTIQTMLVDHRCYRNKIDAPSKQVMRRAYTQYPSGLIKAPDGHAW